MIYRTMIKIGKKEYKTTTSLQTIKESKDNLIKVTIESREFVGDGNGAFEKHEWKNSTKEIHINKLLIETIEEI